MVRFRVDDVAPAGEALPVRPLGELFDDALAIGGDPASLVLAPDGIHPLLSAVGRAFAEHRPLVLSPDAVWLTITGGVAQHVRLHAEALRPRLVAHPGRKRLAVDVDGPMPADPDAWRDAVEVFGKLLAAETAGTGLFECDFSTSTDVERVAGRIVLLDAYSPYFALWMRFICGIPSITLTGTVEDWQKIRTRIDGLAGYGLDNWCRSLAPIADQLVRAAAGDVDTAFWKRIYSPADAYGASVVTGWAARLYPYLLGVGAVDVPNPLLDLPIDEPRDLTGDDRMGYDGPGVRTSAVPATLSRVIVNVNDRVTGDNRVVALHAGLVGVAQDPDGALRPIAGWHLTPAAVEIGDVIDRIVRDHETTPPQPAVMWNAASDLVAVHDRIGSARLFDGAWRLLPIAEQRWIFRDGVRSPIVAVIDLADGRVIGAVSEPDTGDTHWVTCRIEPVPATAQGMLRGRLIDDPGDVPVYGTSLALLLDAALDSGGDIAHLRTGDLSQLNDEADRRAQREDEDARQ